MPKLLPGDDSKLAGGKSLMGFSRRRLVALDCGEV